MAKNGSCPEAILVRGGRPQGGTGDGKTVESPRKGAPQVTSSAPEKIRAQSTSAETALMTLQENPPASRGLLVAIF